LDRKLLHIGSQANRWCKSPFIGSLARNHDWRTTCSVLNLCRFDILHTWSISSAISTSESHFSIHSNSSSWFWSISWSTTFQWI